MRRFILDDYGDNQGVSLPDNRINTASTVDIKYNQPFKAITVT